MSGPRHRLSLRNWVSGRACKRCRRLVAAGLGRLALHGLSWLPRRAVHVAGGLVGTLIWALAVRSRRLASANLERALGGEFDSRVRRRIVRRMFTHFARTFLDIVVMHRWGPRRVHDRIVVHGWPEYEARMSGVLSEGRGAIGLSGHLGNWELLACRGSHEWGDQLRCVAKRYRYAPYNDLVERVRTGLGVKVIYQDESPRLLVRLLRSGGLLALLPDQDAKKVHGLFTDFFGHTAYTPSAPASLCLRLGAPIVPSFVVREGLEYRVLALEPIRPEEAAGAEDPVLWLTRRWTTVLEDAIRRYPEQWVWTHRRWRSTPEMVDRRRRAEPLARMARER